MGIIESLQELALGAAGFIALSLGASTAVFLGSMAMTVGEIAAIAGGTAMGGVMLQLASGVTGIGYNLRPLTKQESVWGYLLMT